MTVRVLYSFGPTDRTRNPFTALLADSVRDDVTVLFFSWRTAFLGRYDVLHVHWPEALLKDRTRLRRAARWCAFVGLVSLVTVRRRTLVWTVHNRRPHADNRRTTAWALRYFERHVDVFVVLFRFEVERMAGLGREAVWIPHGEYPTRGGAAARDRCTVTLFGLLRPYKQIEQLIAAFADSTTPRALTIAGRPMPAAYGTTIADLARRDARIVVRPEFLAEPELEALLATTALAVFPYRDLYSSGAVLLALSHGVPVLLPRSAVATELRGEIGDHWVLTYDGELSAPALDAALETVGRPPTGAPDLGRRHWADIGRQHVELYERMRR